MQSTRDRDHIMPSIPSGIFFDNRQSYPAKSSLSFLPELLLPASHIIFSPVIMQSSQCIHRIIPASREFSRREQALTSVGAVDDHRTFVISASTSSSCS